MNTKQQKRPTKGNVIKQRVTVFEIFDGVMDKDFDYEVHLPSENEEDRVKMKKTGWIYQH